MTRKKDLEEPISSSTAEGDESGREPAEEKVGYGRPPVSTRFKPGQSGNPRGRPKGSKSLEQVLRQALNRRVQDTRRGGRHTVRMAELIIEGLVFAAAKRDPQMLRLLLAFLDRYAPSDAPKVDPQEVRAADREILDEYISSIMAALDGKKGKS
jgi:hypothetical protein